MGCLLLQQTVLGTLPVAPAPAAAAAAATVLAAAAAVAAAEEASIAAMKGDM